MYLTFENRDIPPDLRVHVKASNVGASYSLSKEDMDCRKKLISVIKQKKSSVDIKVSDKFLEDLIMESVVNLSTLERSKAYEKAIVEADKIIVEVTTGYKEFMVITTLKNFQSEIEKFTIGKVIFSRIEVNAIDFVKNLPEDSGIRNRIDLFNQNTVAQTIVEAKDKIKAQELGLAQIDLSLDIIRFYGLSFYGGSHEFLKNRFNRDGLIFAGSSLVITYEEETPGVGAISSSREGYLYPFVFQKDFPEYMSKAQFDVLDTILKKDDWERTKFETRILQAVRMVGSSSMSYDNYDAFLKIIISLETLLLKEREQRSVNISERLALTISTDRDERLKIFCKMKKLYQIRNKIVHHGLQDVTQLQRVQLEYWAYLCIIIILGTYQTENIETIASFIKMINRLKFSSDSPPARAPP